MTVIVLTHLLFIRSKYEIKAQKQLEIEGWLVDYKVRPSRYFAGQPTDYYHLFDLIAVKKNQPLRFISIKGHAGVSTKHKQAIKEFWLPACCQKEIWVWPRNKKIIGFKIQIVL